MKVAIDNILSYLIAYAHKLSLCKWSGVHFIQSEVYPKGCYRIHESNILPPILRSAEPIGNSARIIEECVAELNVPWVEWDRASLWLTIHVQ